MILNSARLILLATALLLSPFASAHFADRVGASVNPAERVVLTGHRVAWASAQNDQGAVPGDLPLVQVTAVLQRSLDRQRAFEQLLKDQQDPASANYHRWLTSLELGEKFGVSQHDIDAISGWLRGQGLHVDAVSNSRMRITFSGTAKTVGAAFATEMHRYRVEGETRIAPARDPQIPKALRDVVQSIRGLHTTRNRTYHETKVRQYSVSTSLNQPEETNCQGSVCTNTIFPSDFATIYNLNPISQQGIDGSGQTIAIVGKARVSNADIENFEHVAGLAKKDPVVIVPPGVIDPGAAQTSCTDTFNCSGASAQSEASLDVERAVSVAPGATIDLVVSDDTATRDGTDIATEYVIDTNPVIARILSISFGLCEGSTTAFDASALDEQFRQAAAEGISVFVASGDSGAAGCDPTSGAPPPVQTLSANVLCASGYVTCVGGTEFADAANPGAFWSSNDSNNFESALGYIPEGAWNDPFDGNGNPQAVGSGGGVSAYLPTPSWQTGPGVPGTQGRYTPDVAFSASLHDGYFACMAAAAAGAGSSCVVTNGGFGYLNASGTSAATPSMAGVAALLNQKLGGAQGNLNPRLYALAAAPGDGVFHDVTVSTSGVPVCQIFTPSLCNNSTPGPSGLTGGLQGYLVGPGFDEVTGLGSINVANLLAQWNAPAFVNLDQHGLTGSWYDPATGGQGFEIEVYPDLNGPGQGLLFAGWFTYDVTAAGGRRWYGLTGNVITSSASGALQIFAVEGGNLNAPPSVGANGALGQATIQFSNCNTGSMVYNFTDGSGRSGTIPLARLTPNATCSSAGDNGTPASDYLLSGNWFNPNTSGQGLIFDFSPSINGIFAAWYTFMPNGQQIGGPASQSWFTLQSNQFVPGMRSLDNIPIVETSGGVFDDPAATTSIQAGTATIAFQSCNAMTMSYAFTAGENQGLVGTINLQRVGPTPAGCSF